VDVVHRLSWTGRTQERSELEWTGPALVGVLNVTPDSFSDGGSLDSVEDAVAVGVGMAEAGALFVDVGGESTRPGAAPVTESEELARVLPVVEGLSARGVRVSIDSRHAAVAEAALAAGAAVVNDVSGLRDAEMIAVCAAAGVPVVIVHMQGDPQTLQLGPTYEDVVGEVSEYLLEAAERALAAGVPSVVIDPGIGFGKTLEHNLELIRATGRLAGTGHPVMVGASRKGFVGRLTGVAEPRDRLAGSLAAHLYAAERGAALLRVHDVDAHRQALSVLGALRGASSGGEGG